MSPVYAAEREERVSREVRCGENSIFFLKAKGPRGFCEYIKKSDQREEGTHQKFTIPLVTGEITAQISDGGYSFG